MTQIEPSEEKEKPEKTINPLISVALIGLISPFITGVFSIAITSIEQSPEPEISEQIEVTEDCSELRSTILEQQEINPDSSKIGFPEDSPEQTICHINEFMKEISD